MTRIKVFTDATKVKIKISDQKETSEVSSRAPIKPERAAGDILSLSRQLINLMEIRTESVFRPGEEDVEVLYALSGSDVNSPDILHKFSSNMVIQSSSSSYIASHMEAIAEHLRKERDTSPKLIVLIHTHPQGVATPSETDKEYFAGMTEAIEAAFRCRVLFGVHAISREAIRERHEPAKVAKNRIKWSSITRDHEISFYNSQVKPQEVEIVG